jgi:hypothetical protein
MMEDDGFAFVKIRHGDREIGERCFTSFNMTKK